MKQHNLSVTLKMLFVLFDFKFFNFEDVMDPNESIIKSSLPYLIPHITRLN